LRTIQVSLPPEALLLSTSLTKKLLEQGDDQAEDKRLLETALESSGTLADDIQVKALHLCLSSAGLPGCSKLTKVLRDESNRRKSEKRKREDSSHDSQTSSTEDTVTDDGRWYKLLRNLSAALIEYLHSKYNETPRFLEAELVKYVLASIEVHGSLSAVNADKLSKLKTLVCYDEED